MPTKEEAIAALKTVMDPELHIDIWKLGLIYDVDVKGESVHVKMTLTTPFCPMANPLMLSVKESLVKIGFKDPEVELTFNPPWEPNEEVRALLEAKFQSQ